MRSTNEAYAFASCTGCAAVAIGFQVVLIIGQTNVIVPENLSAAVNYNCVQCLTYALASQLVLTLDGPLSADGMAKLAALWDEIAAFGRTLENMPLSEIQDRLTDFKQQITEIIMQDPSTTTGTQTATPTGQGTSGPGQTSPTPVEPGQPQPTSPGIIPATGEPLPETAPAPQDPATAAPTTPAVTTLAGATPVPTSP